MPIALEQKHGGNVLEVHVRGKLAAEDQEQLVPEFKRLIRTHGKIRILLPNDGLSRLEAGALWEEIKFDVKHFPGHRTDRHRRRNEMAKCHEPVLPPIHHGPHSLL